MVSGSTAQLRGPVTMNVPFSARSAAQVREALAVWLVHRGVQPPVVDDARLIASELVGNAVRHAAPLGNGTLLVRWREQDSALQLSVCDGGGSTRPERVTADPQDESGRGLSLVEALCWTWRVEQTRGVHSVHVVLRFG